MNDKSQLSRTGRGVDGQFGAAGMLAIFYGDISRDRFRINGYFLIYTIW
jgi:hypothetical protein